MSELFLGFVQKKNCQLGYITFATMLQEKNAKGMAEAAEKIEAKMLSMQNC